MPFWAYILYCNAGVLFTGHTDGLERRVAQHKAGHFPGFTRNYLPVELVWSQEFTTRERRKQLRNASKAGRALKNWR